MQPEIRPELAAAIAVYVGTVDLPARPADADSEEYGDWEYDRTQAVWQGLDELANLVERVGSGLKYPPTAYYEHDGLAMQEYRGIYCDRAGGSHFDVNLFEDAVTVALAEDAPPDSFQQYATLVAEAYDIDSADALRNLLSRAGHLMVAYADGVSLEDMGLVWERLD